MKIAGIIVEYNPFHNGHLYHLNKTKEITGSDAVIAVMSGNFIQRGEPAIINKWARAKAALLNGVDMVVELPLPFSLGSAEAFGFGAVHLLHSMGIIDSICFGSESGNIEELKMIAKILVEEPGQYKFFLKEELQKGQSFASSREKALNKYFKVNSCEIETGDILASSNNILGLEYLKALLRLRSNIKPYTLNRVSNNYNQKDLTGSISSATAIRSTIFNEGIYDKSYKVTLPVNTVEIMEEEFACGRGPVNIDAYEGMLLYQLRRTSAKELRSYPYVNEGLEYKIKKASDGCCSIEQLIINILSKRYTRTRIQRTLMSVLLDFKREAAEYYYKNGSPYIRILGFSEKGKHLLKYIKKASALPLITKTADYKQSDNRAIKMLLDIESKATDIYVLGYTNTDYKNGGQEFTNPFPIV